ncbi:MAG: tryptophan synthase subunit alpha [Candidatus Sumerlaeota bacterium]
MNRIEKHFAERPDGAKSLILFLTAGYPDLESTEKIIETIEESGCDILELGVPFSDPVADGPTIQAASTEALKTGTTLKKILDLVEKIRKRSDMPILLFGACNPFYHFGLETLGQRASEAGVDGFLVPDVPLEEGADLEAMCARHGFSLIYLVAPTTPPERMRAYAERGSGFLYYVSMKGVTGSSIQIDPQLRRQVGELKQIAAPLPVAIGFGVKTPEHARSVAEIADAVVVGSQLIRVVGEHADDREAMLKAVGDFTRSLKQAIL